MRVVVLCAALSAFCLQISCDSANNEKTNTECDEVIFQSDDDYMGEYTDLWNQISYDPVSEVSALFGVWTGIHVDSSGNKEFEYELNLSSAQTSTSDTVEKYLRTWVPTCAASDTCVVEDWEFCAERGISVSIDYNFTIMSSSIPAISDGFNSSGSLFINMQCDTIESDVTQDDFCVPTLSLDIENDTLWFSIALVDSATVYSRLLDDNTPEWTKGEGISFQAI